MTPWTKQIHSKPENQRGNTTSGSWVSVLRAQCCWGSFTVQLRAQHPSSSYLRTVATESLANRSTAESLCSLFRISVVLTVKMQKEDPCLLSPEIKLCSSRAHVLGAGREQREETASLFKTCQVETFTETLILLIKQEKTFVVKLMQLWNNRTN